MHFRGFATFHSSMMRIIHYITEPTNVGSIHSLSPLLEMLHKLK